MKPSFVEREPHKDLFLLQGLWADVILMPMVPLHFSSLGTHILQPSQAIVQSSVFATRRYTASLLMFTPGTCEITVHIALVWGYFSDSQHLLWEKWTFKGELNEQEEAHGHKDPLSCVEGKGTTRDESSLSCLIFFEGLTQTLSCDTMAEGLGSVKGANLYEFVLQSSQR